MPAFAADLSFRVTGPETLQDDLRGASLVQQILVEEEAPAARDLIAAAQADYQRMLAVLFEAGHFGPTISITVDGTEAAALPLVTQPRSITDIVIIVEAGPRFLFGQASIGPVPQNTQLPPGFARGEPAGLAVMRETTSRGIDAWRRQGHAKAELASQEIVANHPAQVLDVDLRLTPGPQLRYGATAVEGNSAVRTEQILRIADLREGRIYDPDEIQASARRLQRSGAFRSVSISEAEDIGPDATLPLQIEVIEQLPRRFGVGAELGSTEGASLSAFWLHRNLTGYADQFRVDGEVSGIGGDSGGADFSLGFGYTRPSTFNPETDLFINGSAERLDQPDFTSDAFSISAGARRIASEEFSYEYGLSYRYSDTTDAFGSREFSILSIPLAATYDRRDRDLNPSDGYYIEAGLEPFNGFAVAGAGTRFNADLRGYQGFGREERDSTVAALRVQLGAIFGPELGEVPPEWLYFSGGGGTVRGQPFQDLAVVLPTGERVGGRSYLGLSAEIRQRVTENIGVVGFVDAGWISAETDFTGGDNHVGAGLGVRYDTGIGPIRVDLGLPVSGPNDNSGVELYIGIGQAF